MKTTTKLIIGLILIVLSCTASKCLSKPYEVENYLITVTNDSDIPINNMLRGVQAQNSSEWVWTEYNSTQLVDHIAFSANSSFDVRHQFRVDDKVIIDTIQHYDAIPFGDGTVYVNFIIQEDGLLKIVRTR